MLSELYDRIKGNDQRTALVRKNILASFLIKGWSALIIYLMVPLTLFTLGLYKNGVWLTISSILVWIDSMDIGLGNGLRNQLTIHLAHNDYKKAQEAVSSAFFMLILIIIPTSLLLNVFILLINNYAFFNVDESVIPDLDMILAVSVMFVSITFIFKFISNFYLALQLPAVNNLLITIGQTLALFGTFIVYISGKHSLFLISVINTASPLIVYLLAYPYTFWKKYPQLRPSIRCFNKHVAKSLLTLGVKFFVLQICGMLLFMTSNILIQKLISPEEVNPYQITYRYFSIVLTLFIVVNTPFWSATTDAYARKDLEWIRISKKRMEKVLAVVSISIIFMICISQFVYHIWVHDEVVITTETTACMGIYMMILISSLCYSNFLNGIGALHIQLIMTTCAAILFIPLALLSIHCIHSVVGMLIAMSLINIPGLVMNIVQFNKIINNKARGIWLK
ncbi:MAG: hypothetical protein IJ604_03855 [Prevotella sp.]|nr:hypothetical protein [Prevotella sp.]